MLRLSSVHLTKACTIQQERKYLKSSFKMYAVICIKTLTALTANILSKMLIDFALLPTANLKSVSTLNL